MKHKVLLTAPYMQQDLDRFLDFFAKNDISIDVPYIEERMNEEKLLEIIENYDGAITGDDEFTRKVFEKALNLKVISKWGTGINSIDSHPVADTVMAYILGFSRNIIQSDKLMKAGQWQKIRGKSLSEQTIGIIGLGNIGTQVARRANAFNMNILGNDIREIPSVLIEQYNIKIVSKDELYANSDYISLNCDLNKTNYHLLDKSAFLKMNRKPYIINTARGPLIKEEDLITALEDNNISGVGLDVYEHEPLPIDSILRTMDNCILSAHNSNSSPKYWDIVHENTLKNLLKGLKGCK
jgi:D-3-phosphoglycerate dehydrogenase